MLNEEAIGRNWQKLTAQLQEIAEHHVDIVAVTKKHPSELYATCKRLGIKHIGENRAQELTAKADSIPDGIVMHFVAPLQTNKVKYLADRVHSFDALASVNTLRALEKKWQADELAPIDVLIQINSTNEEQKAGITLENLSEAYELVAAASESKHVLLKGLMTMGPTPRERFSPGEPAYDEAAEAAFEKTRMLRDRLQAETGQQLPRLSMGMSHDYPLAVAQGATEIRVGTLLFGERPQ